MFDAAGLTGRPLLFARTWHCGIPLGPIGQRYRAMTDSNRYVGPARLGCAGSRKWGCLSRSIPSQCSCLQRCSALSGLSPSERPSTSWPAPRENSLSAAAVASQLSEKDWAELTRLNEKSAVVPRKVTGELPSTSRKRNCLRGQTVDHRWIS